MPDSTNSPNPMSFEALSFHASDVGTMSEESGSAVLSGTESASKVPLFLGSLTAGPFGPLAQWGTQKLGGTINPIANQQSFWSRNLIGSLILITLALIIISKAIPAIIGDDSTNVFIDETKSSLKQSDWKSNARSKAVRAAVTKGA